MDKENKYTVRRWAESLVPPPWPFGYGFNPHPFRGDYAMSPEEADRLGFKEQSNGHRADHVKKSFVHPTKDERSLGGGGRGIWIQDQLGRSYFKLNNLGMQDPNYTLFGLLDNGDYDTIILAPDGSLLLPEITVTPWGNHVKDSYNNIELYKKGSKIHIKKENRGKFTDYCNGKVTDECIQKGKRSPDPKIRKRATFAANVRKWNHD